MSCVTFNNGSNTYHYSDIRNEFDENEFTPENIERHVQRVLPHWSAHNNGFVGDWVSLERKQFFVKSMNS